MKSYTIHYDRTYLIGKGLFNLFLALALFIFLPLFTLNPLIIFLGLTVCWFTGKAAIRALYRVIKHKPVCILNATDMEIAMPNGEGKIMKVKDITRIDVNYTKNRYRMVIHGSHIEHPSGAYLIDIRYPFAKQQLPSLHDHVMTWAEKHHIEVVRIQQSKEAVLRV